MNVQKNIRFLYLLLVVGLLTTHAAYSQNNKKIDSILRVAATEIYVNPIHVIQLGHTVVKLSGENVDYKIKGYKLVSDAYSSSRNYEKSLEYVIKANELLDESNDKLLKITILNKLGIQYHQLKVYDKAIQYLDQAEQLIGEYPVKDSIHSELGKNYVVRGFIYKEKLSCSIAIAFLDRGIAELLKSKKESDLSKISIAIYNKGNCYLLLHNNELAIDNFQKAIQAAKRVKARSLQSFALKGLAKVYNLQGKNIEAIQALNEAVQLSSEVNDLILNLEIYKGLAENYLIINDWKQFEVYQLKFVEALKSIKDSERLSVGESLSVKEAESKANRSELSIKFYYLLLVLGLVLTLVILFFCVIIKRKCKEIEVVKSQIYILQNKKGKEV